MAELSRIAECSQLPIRKLRYVLDQGLLPGGDVASRGRGAARSFTPFEAFGIVTAALMLHAGLKRALIRESLAVLCRGSSRGVIDVPLYRAFSSDGASRLELGDWAHVRLSGSGRLPGAAFDTLWIPLAGDQALPANHQPLVTIAIDLTQIRSQLNPIR